MSAPPSPWRLGQLTVRQLLTRVWEAAWVDEITDRAAALSYYFLFSIFPILLFFTALAHLVPVHHLVRQLMETVAVLLPAEAASLVRETLRQVVTRTGRPGLVSLGALTAIWAGSAGMASVMTMLNVVYHVRDDRPWWRRRATAVLLTVAFAVFLIGATLLLMLSTRIGGAVARVVAPRAGLEGLGNAVTLVLALGGALLAFELIYYLAPARARWHWLTPGSLTAAILWMATSLGLRLYVTSVAHYDIMYGSIGGIILLLLAMMATGPARQLWAEHQQIRSDEATLAGGNAEANASARMLRG